MPILSAEDTFTIGDATTLGTLSVDVEVISAPAYPGGKGRLSHPTLGIYDYDIAPDEWSNLDDDILFTPVWEHTRTLSGNASTRWAGYISDPEVSERWTGRVTMKGAQWRMLVAMYRNPPAEGEIVWSPNYTTANSYNVQIVSLTSGGSAGATLDYLILQGPGYAKGPFEITYRIKSKVE